MSTLSIAKTDLIAKDAAKLIRKELKKAFPGVKFSVYSSRFSGGESVSVSYTDGPERADVREVACKFGHYSGMDEADNSQFADGDMVMTSNGPVVYSFQGFVCVQRHEAA